MTRPVLAAGVEPEEGGRWRVLSPGVGWWTEPPAAFALLGPGARVGVLLQGNRRLDLVLPPGVSGRLSGSPPTDRIVPVAYAQPLFTLSPLGEAAADVPHARSSTSPGLPPGAHAVVSPTDGVFYARPSPGAPAFVEAGARVRAGQPIGLVEVMKTFNQVLYGGPDLPREALVLEVRGGDGQEVRAGQVLLVVR